MPISTAAWPWTRWPATTTEEDLDGDGFLDTTDEDTNGDGKIDPMGYKVPHGSSSIYLDYDGNQRIGASVTARSCRSASSST